MTPDINKSLSVTTLPDPAGPIQDANWSLASGLVVEVASTDHVRIDMDGSVHVARRAASCLLEPALGDRVLVAHADTGTYVVAVLERPGPLAAVLSANVPAGHLAIHDKTISITADERVSIGTPAMTIHTQALSLFAGATSLVGRMFTQAVQKWRLSAREVAVVSDDIAMQAARRTSVIAETDVLKAETLVQNIASTAVTNAHSAVVAVREDLRLDGERVTVG